MSVISQVNNEVKNTVDVTIMFAQDDIIWMRDKFEIKTQADLRDAVIECIQTYMEL